MRELKKPLTEFLQGKNLLKVTSINLQGENLSAIPDIVFKCKNLRKLNLSNNQLVTIPQEITCLKTLKVLNLRSNRITQIHAWIGKMKALKTLDVSHNQIKTLPQQIQFINLERLIASHNLITTIDGIVIPSIKYLVISHNKIEKLSLHPLFINLSHLWINGNPCETQIRSIMSNIRSIRKVYPKVSVIQEDKTQNISNDMQMHRIFISYSHEDKKWLDTVTLSLKTISNTIGGIDVWADTRIKTGDKWKDEIEAALQSCGVAILLVSPNFVASDFIINNELPPILKKAAANGTHIFPICVRKISNVVFRNSKLSDFQFLNSPTQPLNNCAEAEIDNYMCKLLDEISDKLGLSE